jgi:hypothetical protein
LLKLLLYFSEAIVGHVGIESIEYNRGWQRTNGHDPGMKKSELLHALQTEIQKHNLSTFMHEEHKVVLTGCSLCRKHFGAVERFKFHIPDDVLPPLLDKLSVEAK